MGPDLALAGCPLRLPPLSSSVSRASCAFLRCMLSLSTPVDLQSAFVADFLCNAGLPRVSVGSASTTSVSRPHRAFTCVTACIFAGSPSGPFHRRLRQLPLRLLLGKRPFPGGVQSPHSGKNQQKPPVFGAERRLVTHAEGYYRRNFRQCKGGAEFPEPMDFFVLRGN